LERKSKQHFDREYLISEAVFRSYLERTGSHASIGVTQNGARNEFQAEGQSAFGLADLKIQAELSVTT